MAFTQKKEEFEPTANHKQHLNLSSLAWEIMDYDMLTFHAESRSGFLNRVFRNYYPLAEASISLVLNRMQNDLSRLLSDVSGDDLIRQQIADKFLAKEAHRLHEKASSYEKGTGFKFWLNAENFRYLTQKNGECNENNYYSTQGKYIKSVFEEYARLPYVEREKIYFAESFITIENAVKGTDPLNPSRSPRAYRLRVVTDSETTYSVYPYKILQDPLSTANYLVGYGRRYDKPEEEKRPCSFRISALKDITGEKSKSAFLKDQEKKYLEQCILSRGVQFLVGEQNEIKIRLTKAGLGKYHRQTHLRPLLSRENKGDIYTADCTPAQAEFYFFKFGSDAEILSPPDLREKVLSKYEDAVNAYKNPNIQRGDGK